MPTRRDNRPRSDRGETLIEILVTVTILGFAGVAVTSSLFTLAKVSDQHSKQATSGAYVRSWAERIQTSIDRDKKLPTCAAASSYYMAVGQALIDEDPSDALTSGYSPSLATSSVQTAPVMSWGGSAWGACSANGVQRVLLKYKSPGDATHTVDESLTVVLRNPCNGDASSAGQDPCS